MLLGLNIRYIRYSLNLLNNFHVNLIISRNISMSQKTLLSFFKPPKASNNVLTAVNSTKETDSSALADSPKKSSSPKHRKRVRQLVESDDENVEQDHCLNGTPLDSPVRSPADSEATKRGNIPHESVDKIVESETVPLRVTARKTMPSPYIKRLLSGVKTSTDESTVKSETLENQSVDVEMKEVKDKSVDTEVSENATASENSETATNIHKEGDSKNSRKSTSPQKKVDKSDCAGTDEKGKPTEQAEKVTPSSKSPESKKTESKKRKKNEEKSPEEGSPKKAKKRGRPKKTEESNDREEKSEKKKPGSSGKAAEHSSEANTKTSVEKSSADKKEKKLIHNFFARTSAPRSSSEGNPPAKEESRSSDTEGNEPLPKAKTTDDGSLDTEMKDQEDENSGVPANFQVEKQSLKNSRKSGSKLKKGAGKDENQVPVSKSPQKQKSDTKKPGKHEAEKCPAESSPVKQKKARCAKKIVESDDEEVGSEGKDSNESDKSDLDCGVIEEAENEVPEKKQKTPIHSFFTPKTKQDKNEKTGSQKESKAPGSEKNSIYDPTKRHYHPVDDACWKKGEKVPYLALARTMEEIENISGRLKIIEMLANYFRSVLVLSPDDLLPSVYLCVNRIAPEYEGVEMGVGETLLMKAVAQATGRTLDKIKAETAVKGDLGLVAESSRGNQRYMFAPPKLTVASVFSKFREIALMSGNAAMSKKVDKIQALFVACRHCEARYIIRSLSGKLRIGLAEQSVLAALSQATVLTPPNQSYPPEILNSSSNMSSESFKKKLDAQTLILKTTYCECPNYDKIIPVLLKEGIEGLPNHCYLTPGIPLKPMLAHPTKGIDEVLQRFDGVEFTCEFKYDGERAQIHVMENGDVKIYSRNQEDNTSKYPDIISRISKALKPETKSCVLDTEAVAWDRDEKQILPFQQLSTRKRKDVQESEIKVQVCVVAFDLIFLNGKSLVKLPLKERRRLMRESFIEVENEFMFVHCTDGNTAEVMQEFLEESIKGNCEGLMVKSLEVDASYEIAKRSHNWLKLKKDYLEGVGDTLDLVVIGGYHGRGKRTGAYGGFLLACYDDENEEFQTICKIGTGFKDEKLESHTSFLKEHVINEPKSYFRFDSSLTPDVWFEPVQVWEVKCADLSKSPVHKAAVGIVDPEKGISLRFPRFLRIRDDKKPEDATNATQVARMYNSQEQIQNQKSKEPKVDDEDFY